MLWFLALPAQAEDVFEEGDTPAYNMQNFRPAVGRQDMLWVNETRIERSNLLSIRNLFHYSKDPFSYRNYRGERIRILSDIVQTDVLASYSMGRFQLGLGVPVYLRARNNRGQGETGLGDIWLDGKVRVLDRDDSTVGLAFSIRSTLPTSMMSAPLGTEGMALEAELAVDKNIGSNVFACNLGHRQLPSTTLEELSLGSQLFARMGMAYHIEENFGLSTELSASWSYQGFTQSASSPFEALLGSWKRFSKDDSWLLRAGFGLGLNEAVSTAAVRGLIGVSYEPGSFKDTDEDKIRDEDDACPVEAEDFDGVLDEDGCPEPTQIFFTAVDQFGAGIAEFSWTFDGTEGTQSEQAAVYGGLHPITVSAIGHKDLVVDLEIPDVERFDVQLPMEVLLSDLRVVAQSSSKDELLSAIWTATGKGMPNNIPGSRTAQVRVGDNEIIVRAPGFRRKTVHVHVLAEQSNESIVQLERAKASLRDGQIIIEEKVFFGQDSDEILESSNEILVEVAEFLQDNPKIIRIRIEGHTDALGEAEYNVELSQKRAQAVRLFLQEHGVDLARMQAIGLGEVRPIGSNRNAEGRAENRRVEFHVEEIQSNEVELESPAE